MPPSLATFLLPTELLPARSPAQRGWPWVCFHPWLSGLSHLHAPPQVLSSQGFRLSFERVTSKRTCLQRAQPDPGLAARPDSRWLGTKASLFPRPPDAPKCTGHKKSFFPQFRSLQAQALCHREWPCPPLPGEPWGWGVRELPAPHPHHPPIPFGQPDYGGSLGPTSKPLVQAPHCPSATKPIQRVQWPPHFSHPSEPYPSFQASSRQHLRTPSPQKSLTTQTTATNLSFLSLGPTRRKQVSPASIPKQGP